MQNRLIRKGSVYVIVILFIGTSVVTNISGNVGRNINVSNNEPNYVNKGQILDLAVAKSEGSVGVLLGDGQGGFGDYQDYPVGNEPYDIVTGDFNEDEYLDLAVANFVGDDISVLFGDGYGGFGNRQDYLVGDEPVGIVTGDFNEDENLDLVVTNSRDGDISVFLGDGSGNFSDRQDYPVEDYPEKIIAADFNKDDNLDLAVTNSNVMYDYVVSILLGDGNGHFGDCMHYEVGEVAYNIVTGDFNEDENLDLAVTNDMDCDVSVLLGDGNGHFGNRQDYPVDGGPAGIVIGDFNEDENLDLAVAIFEGMGISVLFGDGSGHFGDRQDYSVDGGALGIVTGDFNMDGHFDLAVSVWQGYSSVICIFLGDGNGNFGDYQEYIAGGIDIPDDIVAGDFDSASGDLVLEIKGGLGVTATIKNYGEEDAIDVDWSISATGGILGLINKQVSDTISIIPVGGEETVNSGIFFGLGKVSINVTATGSEGTVKKTVNGFVLLFLVIIPQQ